MAPEDLCVFQRPAPIASAAKGPMRTFGSTPAIKQFCLAHGLMKPIGQDKDGNPGFSHFTYGGLYSMGKLCVPPGESTRDLARAYVADFKAGWFTALTENRPSMGHMRMYFDYDLETEEYPEEAFWTKMEQIEKREVMRFFPGKPPSDCMFHSTVATSGVIDVVQDDGKVRYKAGVHVYYPNLFVSVEMALYISTAVLSAAKREWPKPEGTWEKQIDQGVYAPTRGLRWVWQFKSKVCERCTRPKGASKAVDGGSKKRPRTGWCEACDQSGQVPDTSATLYAPLYRADGLGCREAVRPPCRNLPTVELMLECSVRAVFSAEPSEGFLRYPGAEGVPRLTRTSGPAGVVQVQSSGDKLLQATYRGVYELLSRKSMKYRLLEEAIRRVDTAYKEVDIRQAFKMSPGRGTYYRVFLGGVGSGFCFNMGSSHEHAHVYFVVMKTGMIQKCSCTCPKTRESGKFCSQFESNRFALQAHEVAGLFETPQALDLFLAPAASSNLMLRTMDPDAASRVASDCSAFTAVAAGSRFVKALKARNHDYFCSVSAKFVGLQTKAHFASDRRPTQQEKK